ncbi:MAG: hypothetical protein ACI8R4_000084 [Paracoccaceae bacterium]
MRRSGFFDDFQLSEARIIDAKAGVRNIAREFNVVSEARGRLCVPVIFLPGVYFSEADSGRRLSQGMRQADVWLLLAQVAFMAIR